MAGDYISKGGIWEGWMVEAVDPTPASKLLTIVLSCGASAMAISLFTGSGARGKCVDEV